MEAETKEKGTFQPLQGHFLPWNPIYVPNSFIRHVIPLNILVFSSHKPFWLMLRMPFSPPPFGTQGLGGTPADRYGIF